MTILKVLLLNLLLALAFAALYGWLRYRADKRARLATILQRLMELHRLEELSYDELEERQDLMQELEENYPCQK